MKFFTSTLAIVASLLSVSGLPTRRAPGDNTVSINSASDYCMVFPLAQHTNIGDSEFPGGTQIICSPQGFFTNPHYVEENGVNGQPYVQLTGPINPNAVPFLNPGDAGGQYDSNGGPDGQGNPVGSVCAGYNSYVELIEPAGPRACIRCCMDPADCPVTMDTSGCPNVIPGDYS